MILATVISLLLSVPLYEEELKDTLSYSIVETSSKQTLPLERLASPVSVVYLDELEDRLIDSPKKLSAIIPNLHIPDYGSAMTSSIYLRGFGSRMENPVLGLYVDDIPVLNKNVYDMDMLDIRRADMLRGPQGTLYGRNSMCGVLSLSTLSPSDYKGIRAGLEYGSANTLSARASIYRKTDKGLAIGGGVGFRHSDGFYTNAFTGQECDPHDGVSLRLRVEKKLSERLYLENILSAGTLSQGGWPYRQYIPGNGQLMETSYNDRCTYRRLNLTEAVKLRFESEKYTLNSISALQILADRMDLDQDFTPRSMFTLTQIQREAALTQEFILKPGRDWKKDWWNWQSGAFAFWKYNRMSAPVLFKQHGIEDLILGNANDNIPEDISGGYDAPLSIQEDEFLIGSEFNINTFGAALYHESYFTLGNLLLTAGLRIDYEGNIMNYCSDAAIHYRFLPTMKDWKEFQTTYEGMVDNHYVELLPKFSALYELGDFGGKGKASIFGVISKGYRSGGFNTQIFSDILQNMMMNGLMADLGVYLDDAAAAVTAESTAYRPEKTWNYEIGGKMDIRKDRQRFSASASVFYINCRNQQITLFPPGKSTGRMMANVGRSRSIGAEAALQYGIKGLDIAVSYGYTDARFTSYDDGNHNYSGNRIPYSPEHTLNARTSYSFRFDSDIFRNLSIGADCNAVGRIWWDEANTMAEPIIAQIGADAVLGLKWMDIRFRMDNLLNEDFNVFYFKSVGNSFFQRGKPLRWTIGVAIDI